MSEMMPHSTPHRQPPPPMKDIARGCLVFTALLCISLLAFAGVVAICVVGARALFY